MSRAYTRSGERLIDLTKSLSKRSAVIHWRVSNSKLSQILSSKFFFLFRRYFQLYIKQSNSIYIYNPVRIVKAFRIFKKIASENIPSFEYLYSEYIHVYSLCIT